MRRLRCGPALLSAMLLVSFAAVAQESPPPGGGADQEGRKARLAERDRLAGQARQFQQAGKPAEAIEALEGVLALEQEVFGVVHEECAGTLGWIASLAEAGGDFAEARRRLEEARRIQTKLHGPGDWRAADARRALEDLDRRERLTPEERGRLREAQMLFARASALWRAGEPGKGIPLAERSLAILRRLLGEDHPDCADSLDILALLYGSMGDHARAEPLLLQALGMRRKALGEDHPDYALSLNNLAWAYYSTVEYAKAEPLYLQAQDILRRTAGEEFPPYAQSLRNLAELYEAMGAYTKAERVCRRALEIWRRTVGEEHPLYAQSLHSLAEIYRAMGAFAAAEPVCRQVLEVWKKTLGEDHPRYAASLDNLALLYRDMGELAAAEPLYLKALEIRKKVMGEGHPSYATSLNNLAALYYSTGEFSAAEPLYRQALEINRKTLGEDHPHNATSLSNLAELYRAMGKLAAAEPLHRQALEIFKRTVGEEHPLYAQSLHNLALVYHAMGELGAAERLLRRALKIRKKVLGEDHPDVALSLNNLAEIYRAIGEFAAAERLHRQALAIRRKALGKEHPDYAQSLNNLAGLYRVMGEYAKAEPLHREALEIRKKALGEDHADYAVVLNNLARLYQDRGELAAAEPLYRQALGIARQALGEDHPHYAAGQVNLARLYQRMGEYAKAGPLCRQALVIHRRLLDSTFAVQSERQQFQMTRLFRGTLDSFLSLSVLAEVAATDAYAPVLAWKGAIFARQARARVPKRDPDVASLFTELESTSRRLATLCLSTPDPKLQETRRRQIRELTERREELERELSIKSGDFREARAAERLTPMELQGALPSGVLLVDFLEYERTGPAEKDDRPGRREKRHIVAFLVPSEGEIGQVDLGPAAAIARAVDEWRKSIPQKRTSGAGRDLRKLLWEPLTEHLEGVTTVLVSPDGALNRVPFAALPGERPGTYLVEEISIAVLPVPQALPGLLADAPGKEGAESLLLVGDVDYGGAPGAAVGPMASRSAAGTVTGTLPRFPRLPATQAEVAAIRDSFEKRHEDGRVQILHRDQATEAAFRRDAPRHRWLHLATHGFFAPPGLKSALADVGGDRLGEMDVVGYHPGLLSGLALSGANTPPEADGDDGILTALEVASLDLSGVRLAVLSACDTGLGEVAGGEGVLGLQRAFQVAGVKTTVTSLWSVPDRATQMLMERFYANLWDGKLSRLEALRQAQLWLLNEGSRTEDVRRGLGLPEAETGTDEDGRLPPYYWAAFVLSGDWR